MTCDTIDTGSFIETASRSYRLGYTVGESPGATTETFPTLSPQTADPALTQGVVALGDNYAELCFLLALEEGETAATAQVRITRWDRVITPNAGLVLWVPVPVVDLAISTGAQTGVAGTWLPATELFCDTIALVTSSEYDKGYEIQTNAPTGLIASARFDVRGSKYLHVGFALGETPTAATGNFIIKTY
jgi:hypothetical protein